LACRFGGASRGTLFIYKFLTIRVMLAE